SRDDFLPVCGLCRAETVPGRSEPIDVSIYRRPGPSRAPGSGHRGRPLRPGSEDRGKGETVHARLHQEYRVVPGTVAEVSSGPGAPGSAPLDPGKLTEMIRGGSNTCNSPCPSGLMFWTLHSCPFGAQERMIMSQGEPSALRLELLDGNIALLTIDQPGSRANTLGQGMQDELERVLAELGELHDGTPLQ